MVSATLLTLVVIPALFLIWRGRSLEPGLPDDSHATALNEA
jgi:hypothetical protein